MTVDSLDLVKDSFEVFDRNTIDSFELHNDMGVVFWSHNFKTKSSSFSTGIERICGKSRVEFMMNPGKLLELIHPEDKIIAENFKEQLLLGAAQECELRLLCPPAEVCWIRCIGAAFKDSAGSVMAISGVMIDINERKMFEESLKASEKQYRDLIEHSPKAIAVYDQEGLVLFANQAVAKIIGYASPEQLLGKSLAKFITHEGLQSVKERTREALQGKIFHSIDQRLRVDEQRNVDIQGALIYVSYGGKPAVMFVGDDVSEQKAMEAALKEAEAKYRSLVEGALIGVYLVQNDKMVYTNPCLQELAGYSSEELLNMELCQLIHPEDLPIVEEAISDLSSEVQELSRRIRIVSKNGKIILTEAHGSATVYKGEPAIIGTILDITKQQDDLRKVQTMAYHDALTNLPNRYLLNNHLDACIVKACTGAKSLALLFIDLDRFKLINDSMGHKFGDIVLQQAAERLKLSIRNVDTVSRYGGDEFVIVLEDASEAVAAQVAERIVQEFAAPFVIEGQEVFTSPSIGISMYPQDGETADALLNHADMAMYLSKQGGRNIFSFFTPVLEKTISRSMELESGLRKAITRNELKLYYQPIFNLSTGAIVGIEALLRWHHPKLGLVSPTEFIPIAEESGLIIPIGEWVLQTVCWQGSVWSKQGLGPVTIGVNVSSRQFLHTGFVDMVERKMSEYGIKPDTLVLEITESGIEQLNQSLATINSLKALGVKITIDDFGTGHSSLSRLRHFPLDRFKIDRSFTSEIGIEHTTTQLVKTMIDMAKNLNLSVCAEGIETVQQLQFLRENGCNFGQGYYFFHPAPGEEISKRLTAARDSGLTLGIDSFLDKAN